MSQGTIKSLVLERGFGFIRCGKDSYFFHCKAVENADFDLLTVGTPVEFETAVGEDGRTYCTIVRVLSAKA